MKKLSELTVLELLASGDRLDAEREALQKASYLLQSDAKKLMDSPLHLPDWQSQFALTMQAVGILVAARDARSALIELISTELRSRGLETDKALHSETEQTGCANESQTMTANDEEIIIKHVVAEPAELISAEGAKEKT